MSFFSAVKEVMKQEMRHQAEEARVKLLQQVNKVVAQVEDSQLYKQHVEFNEFNFFQLDPEDEGDEDGEEEVEEEIVVGRLVVSSLTLNKLPSPGKQYLVELELGPHKQTTKSIEFTSTEVGWNEQIIRFPVTDLKATLQMRVWEERMGRSDLLIGQVLIPLETLLPKMWSPEEGERSHRYHLFPLEAQQRVYRPKSMHKPLCELGELQAVCKLELTSNNLFQLYANSRALPNSPTKRKRSSVVSGLETANTLQALVALQVRFQAIGIKLLFGPFTPTLPFAHARQFTDPVFSIGFVTATLLVVLFAEVYLFPLYLWMVLMLGVFLQRQQQQAVEEIPLWVEKDPGALNPLQQMSLLLWVADQAVEWLTQAANALERVINALEFRDERASLVLVAGGGLAAAIGCGLLYLYLPWRICLSAAFLGFILSNANYREKIHQLKLRVLRSKRPHSRHASRLMNLVDKLPTTEHLNHIQICQQQQVVIT
ncbi:hypothetical protein BASA81_006635 [Batrachochytrium salamandrivorans]|nr:hypothetical protein BASA81_006635 [Batrachochytrium salamandrivorans]